MKKNVRNRIIALLMLAAIVMTVVPMKEVQAADNYKAWAQSDSRWGSVRLGSGRTVSKAGCLVTSITKLMIQCGLKDEDSFNVKTLTNWLSNHGGLPGGALVWSKPEQYLSSFEYVGRLMDYGSYSASGNNTKLLNYIKKGYHLVIAVKGMGHWVAVDEEKSLATGKIYIMDSASSTQSKNVNITLAGKYGTFNRVEAYKGGTTPYPDAAKKSISKAKVSGVKDLEYTGKALKQSKLKVKLGDKTLKKDLDYEVTYKNNKNAGKATVTIKGIGKYKGSVKKTFKISVKKDRIYKVGDYQYKVYSAKTDGTGYVGLLSSTVSGSKLKELSVPSTVKIGGIKFRVLRIGSRAFKNYTKLESVTIGANVKQIGTECFKGCKKLKTIKVNSKVLNCVEENAFSGIHKNAVFTLKDDKDAELFTKNTGYKKSTMKLK